MSRQTVYYGIDIGSLAKQTYKPRPLWPDVDTLWTSATANTLGKYRQSRRDVADLRALCLAADTDWDAVLVTIDDPSSPFVLTPGVLWRLAKPYSGPVYVEPIIQPPATRLYGSPGLDLGNLTTLLPQTSAGANVVRVASEGAHFITVGSNAVQVYNWNGAAWVLGDLIPGSGNAITLASVVVVPNGNAAVGANNRPADVGMKDVNGNIWSLADLVAKAIMLDTGGVTYNPNNLYVSAYVVDANGNPGNPAAGAGGSRFISGLLTSPISPLWYGTLAIELFVGQEAPCDYRPHVMAQRQVILGPQTFANSTTGGATADTAVLTVPAFNVLSAQLTFSCDPTSPANLWGTLGSPRALQAINTLSKVVVTPQAKATIAAATQDAATSILQNVHDLIQVQMGSDNAAAQAKLLGAELVMFRAFTG